MNKSKLIEMREHADDLIFQIKMLAGSNDTDKATVHLLNLHYELTEAIRLHGIYSSRDTEFHLSYINSCMEMAIHNVAGVHVDNKSRTAKEAREYRERKAA